MPSARRLRSLALALAVGLPACFDGALHAPLDASTADREGDATPDDLPDDRGPVDAPDAAGSDTSDDLGATDADDADAAQDGPIDAPTTDLADAAPDAPDVAADAGMDAATDSATDSATDAPADARDSGADAADAATDVRDSATDAATDSATDAAADVRDSAADVPAGDASVLPADACTNGPGSSLFLVHFDVSGVARPDLWNATCAFSISPLSHCRVELGGSPVVSMSAIPIGPNTPYIRVHYSVMGLNFSRATLYVNARGVLTSPRIRATSGLHGAATTSSPVTLAAFAWYPIDFTTYVQPRDSPLSTTIELTTSAAGGFSNVLVHAVELCLE